MNLSLAGPQERSQAGSEPSLHGPAGLGLGPGSLLGSGVNGGVLADALIIDWRRRTSLPGGPRGLLASCPGGHCPPSWILGSFSLLWEIPPVSFPEALPLCSRQLQGLFHATRKTLPVHQLSLLGRMDAGVTLACFGNYELFLGCGSSEFPTCLGVGVG